MRVWLVMGLAVSAVVARYARPSLGRPDRGSSWLRVVVHLVAGSIAFALLGIKFALIRWRPSLAYDTTPWIGRVVAICFVAIWITNGFAYFTGNL